METLLQEKIPHLLEKHEIHVSDIDVISQELSYHIYTMVFNVCALIATHTLIHDKENRKVEPENIKESLSYVMKKCYKKKTENKNDITKDNYGDKELYKNIDNTQSGGGISIFTIIFTKVLPEKDIFPSAFIKTLLEKFEVVINNNGLKHLKRALKMILSCMLTDLKKSGTVITPNLLHKVIKMKRHSVFL